MIITCCVTAIVTVDYVRETTPYTNFGANPSTGGLLRKWVKYNVKLFLHTYVRTCLLYTSDAADE